MECRLVTLMLFLVVMTMHYTSLKLLLSSSEARKTGMVWNGVLGEKHFVNKRGLIELYRTLKCGTNRFPLLYVSYGCYCGLGGKGWPMDATDWCCHRHDCCYDFAERQGCHPKTDRYKWACQDYTVICDALLDRCEKIICQCDKEAAHCWKFAPFNKRYMFWPSYRCGRKFLSCAFRN